MYFKSAPSSCPYPVPGPPGVSSPLYPATNVQHRRVVEGLEGHYSSKYMEMDQYENRGISTYGFTPIHKEYYTYPYSGLLAVVPRIRTSTNAINLQFQRSIFVYFVPPSSVFASFSCFFSFILG